MYNEKVMQKVVAIQKYLDGSLTMFEVMSHLDISERTMYRYIKKYKEEGPSGMMHKLIGRKSNNSNDKWNGLEKYVAQKRYEGFGAVLLSEKLSECLGYHIPISSLRRKMIKRGYWTQKKPYKKRRQPRKRKPIYGMMIQFDGSYHDWLENGEEMCLLLGVDDATGKIMHVKFAKNESIDDVIIYRGEYFKKYGKPSSIYLDRHASYKVNHRKDQFDHSTITRFERGMNRLGVQVIFAKSAEGKGRVENKFRLFQDRGIKELRLANIKDYTKAEKYVQEVLVPQFNKKYGVKAEQTGDYHSRLSCEEQNNLERLLFALHSPRSMNKLGVVRYQNKKYLLKKGQSLSGSKKVTVQETHKRNIRITQDDIALEYNLLTY